MNSFLISTSASGSLEWLKFPNSRAFHLFHSFNFVGKGSFVAPLLEALDGFYSPMVTIRYSSGFLVLFLCLWGMVLQAQFVDPREADEYFDNQNYLDALPIYKKLVKQEPDEPEYYRKAGICYLKTFLSRTKAAEYLEKALNKKKHDDEVWYFLGKAYMMQNEFEKALEQFETYNEEAGWGKKDDVELLMKQCQNGKEFVKHPLDVTFEPLGPDINTEYPDYYPYVAKDESRLVFTSRRKKNRGGGKEFDGYYASDIWVSEKEEEEGKGSFESPRNAGGQVNTKYDEQAVGLSDDGGLMFVYIDRVKKKGDIYRTEWDRIGFGRMEKLGENVNSDELETSCSISSDRKTLFFASERDGGEGGIDLYMSRKLPTGEWAKAQNLGPKINTEQDEGFPTLSYDNETLYFCSEGHQSMGGFDIFKAEWDPESNTWSEPQNLGYPVNDGTDNRTISYTKDGRNAYLSTFKDEKGEGSLDIFKVTFNEIAEQPVIFKLKLPSGDTADPYFTSPQVTVLDQNFEVYGDYSANRNTGTYTIALPPGEFTMEIQSEDHPLYEEKIKVTEAHQKMGVVEKRVDLKEGKDGK